MLPGCHAKNPSTSWRGAAESVLQRLPWPLVRIDGGFKCSRYGDGCGAWSSRAPLRESVAFPAPHYWSADAMGAHCLPLMTKAMSGYSGGFMRAQRTASLNISGLRPRKGLDERGPLNHVKHGARHRDRRRQRPLAVGLPKANEFVNPERSVVWHDAPNNEAARAVLGAYRVDPVARKARERRLKGRGYLRSIRAVAPLNVYLEAIIATVPAGNLVHASGVYLLCGTVPLSSRAIRFIVARLLFGADLRLLRQTAVLRQSGLAGVDGVAI
jgi:hypothetical protein